MKKKIIKDFNDFQKVIQSFNEDTIYRGVSRASYPILPKVGRQYCIDHFNLKLKYKSLDDYEDKLMLEFKKHALPFLEQRPENEWEWWAIAQHHGLPTRYLDWTFNPLVAAYFAVEDCNNDEDAIVYASDKTQFNNYIDGTNDPLSIDEIFLYYPPHINKRIIAQSGIFTAHNDPTTELNLIDKPASKIKLKKNEKYVLEQIIIPKTIKKDFKRLLNLYGINQATLFPGLDGIAKHLTWLTLD